MNRVNQRGVARRRSLVAVAAVVLTSLVAFGALQRPALAQQEAPAQAGEIAEAGVLDAEPTALDCDGSLTGTAVAQTPTETFAILSEESEARYVAQEELAGQGANEAVGATNAFIGQILFGEDGMPLACSRFDVDLRTLTSDEARRDNFLYGNTLETGTYPLATFILTEVQGLDEALAEGEETTFFLVGDLTVHGVTKAVAWETTVSLEDDALEGSAMTVFEMPDFGIEEPVVGPVLSVDETIALEVDITAERGE